MSTVDQIKSKIDMVSLVSSYIKLEKAGANWKGRCPFHNEKTPSFFASPDRGSYYCFGCHQKGDIFTFVQDFEGLDFLGSLKVLADRAGVSLDKYDRGEKTEKDNLFSVLERAVLFYQNRLSENKEALDYLKNRGVNDETIKNFRLGFAPDDWRELHDYLLSQNVSKQDMLKAGLVKKKDNSDSYYDTFRGRIMFPIGDSSGRIVGFSGRSLLPDDKTPKYLNSPETELFNKSETLFGLDKAKKDIRLKDYSVLVEGQMDLVMLHQIGITNTVASSGTALTPEHLTKLRRLSNRILMAYDGDDAGFSASSRSSKIALSLGMDLKIAVMPPGKDPADLAKEDPEKLRDSFRSSKHIIDFYVDSLLNKKLDPRMMGQEIRKNVLPFVMEIPSMIERSHFIKTIAQKTFIKEEALWEDLKMVDRSPVISEVNKKEVIQRISKLDTIERRVLGIVLWHRDKGGGTEGIDINDIEKRIKEILGDRMQKLLEELEKEKDLLLFETESYYKDRVDLKKDLEELILRLEEEYLKKKLEDTRTKLQQAEQERNSSEVLRYFEECQKILQKIDIIKRFYEKK